MATPVTAKPWFLVPISGPVLAPIELSSKPGGLLLGRHEQCDIRLPANAEGVSRNHARISHDGTRWNVADLGSRWGTFVNGMKLSPHTTVPLGEGDLVRIRPWTFMVTCRAEQRASNIDNDTGQTQVRAVLPDPLRPLAEELLALLLEYTAATGAATNESQLADLLLDAAIKGTRLDSAVMLRPLDNAGNVDVIASRPTRQGKETAPSFSRSLIAAASKGEAAELQSGASENMALSVVQLDITSAICVPLMLAGSVVAYLYLDARGTRTRSFRPGSTAFCVALGRMASMAMTNFKRLEMEKREVAVNTELTAAAAAQKWIMPPRQGRFGVFKTIGETRPGQLIGGDFFDIIPLDNHSLAVALGDVSGKGVVASVLMTAAQGFLHAALTQCTDPVDAVMRLSRFIFPRRPDEKFITLWVGILDSAAGTLTYVDCGHSFAILQHKDGTIQQLDQGGGPPIGVDIQFPYQSETVKFEAGARLMIVSDGIIEQYNALPADAALRRQFAIDGLKAAISKPTADEVAEVFAAVIQHAGTDRLSDDATAAVVRWQEQA
ncbi:MAG: SpoIIE family protein phosphatase [Tepidisphaeraceae bacterium]